MKFVKIDRDNFDIFFKLHEEDFIYDERRDYEGAKAVLNTPQYHPNFVFNNNELVGYFCYWEFDDFVFVEHFAILKNLRNKGYGSKIISDFVKNTNKMIVLECEPPNSEIGKMRIRFYNRHGFEKCDFEYMQPTYHKETEPIVLDFMAQRKLDKSEFEKYKNIIYNKVYNIK